MKTEKKALWYFRFDIFPFKVCKRKLKVKFWEREETYG